MATELREQHSLLPCSPRIKRHLQQEKQGEIGIFTLARSSILHSTGDSQHWQQHWQHWQLRTLANSQQLWHLSQLRYLHTIWAILQNRCHLHSILTPISLIYLGVKLNGHISTTNPEISNSIKKIFIGEIINNSI
jgi:hypothetical protein